MDAVELVAGPAALGRVKLAVVQPDRPVRRVSVQPEFQTGHAGKVRAKRGRGQRPVALQRYLHEVLAFAFAHRYVLFGVFHRVRERGGEPTSGGRRDGAVSRGRPKRTWREIRSIVATAVAEERNEETRHRKKKKKK